MAFKIHGKFMEKETGKGIAGLIAGLRAKSIDKGTRLILGTICFTAGLIFEAIEKLDDGF